MANSNSVIDRLGDQIKTLTITVAVLQSELEEARGLSLGGQGNKNAGGNTILKKENSNDSR